MSPTPSKIGPLAFGDFLAHLRRQGFAIGVDHHLRLQRLLDEIGGRCAPQDLKTLLCPIFATSEKEQSLFHRVFDEYFELFNVAAELREKETSVRSPDVEPGESEALARKSKWRSPLGYTALVILLVALVVFIARSPQIKGWFGQTQPTPTPSEQLSQTQPFTPTAQPTATTATLQTEPVASPTPTSPEPTAGFWIRHRNAIRWAVIIAPLLVFLIYELLLYRRRRLILEGARGRMPPYTWPIAVPAPELKDFKSEQFYRAARGLRRRQIGEFHRLDVARTIAATIDARGYPSFRYRPDSRVTEYLILIDRASWRDHQASFFGSLTEALQREGVFPDREPLRFFFDGDPRVCTSEPKDGAVHLADLQKKYPAHRLLIFGNGERLLDPISGEIESWATMLEEWPERALLTPEPAVSWGLREKRLARHFVLLPATIEGLASLAEAFDLPVAPGFDLYDLDSDPPPPDPDLPVTVEALRGYLGEDAFQWLCACAVYPELHWDLTLFLGSLPCMDAALIGEKSLLRLTRLPWFRAGSIPDELRLQLIGELDQQREGEIRLAIIGLLEKNVPPEKSFAAATRQLDIVVQRSLLSRRDHSKLRQTLVDLKKFSPNEIARDYVLTRFLESAPSSRLAILLPRRLKKVFYEKSISIFGLRTSIRALATLIVMVAVFAGTQPISSVKDASNISLPENLPQVIIDEFGEMVLIPGGKFMMGRNDGPPDEGPAHEVEIKPFFLDKWEVSNQEYKKFVDATGRKAPRHWRLGSYPPSEAGLPVTHVSWDDAVSYAKWANKRLPTEAEWEYVARGGSRGYLYPWGNQWQAGYANVDRKDQPRHPAPVRSFEKDISPFGIHDLAGNVSEWVQDNYSERYGAAPERQLRVYRGGNFLDEPDKSTNTYRWSDFPNNIPADQSLRVGFRCARDVEVPAPATTASPATAASPPSLARLKVAPSSVDFGNQTVISAEGGARSLSLLITNSGTAPLDLNAVSIESNGSGAFRYSVGSCAPYVGSARSAQLQPGAGCRIVARFVPQKPGSYNANLAITGNGLRKIVVPLKGGAVSADATNVEQKAAPSYLQTQPDTGGPTATSGAVRGTVFDVDTKEPLSGAMVRVVNRDTGLVRTARTDKNGEYRISFLPVGYYVITVSSPGYQQTPTSTINITVRILDWSIVNPPAGGLKRLPKKQ